jgi:hypothetical protein
MIENKYFCGDCIHRIKVFTRTNRPVWVCNAGKSITLHEKFPRKRECIYDGERFIKKE